MGRASRARRIATAAAFGGGSLASLGALCWGLLIGETKLARRRIPKAATDPPQAHDTTWAAPDVDITAPPIRIAMLGDSTAAGYGVHRDVETPGVLLAIGISEAARRPVHLSTAAVVGAESGALMDQVEEVLPSSPQLAIIMVGANDVTHRVKPAQSVRFLSDAVIRLRAANVEVVAGTCPDLGTIRPIAQPLRLLVRRMSRNLAAAQTIAVVEAGGRTVSLGDLIGPEFARRRELFADDRFHPSAEGYAAAIAAVLPSALDALGIGTTTAPASVFTTTRARPIAKAAAQAASHPGSEVAATEVHGRQHGRRGRWARLLRRGSPAVGELSAEGAVPVPSDSANP